MEIQALSGHKPGVGYKSGAMMERYSHASQVLDFAAAKEKLEKVLLPEPVAEQRKTAANGGGKNA
jgi:hypothetical protein